MSSTYLEGGEGATYDLRVARVPSLTSFPSCSQTVRVSLKTLSRSSGMSDGLDEMRRIASSCLIERLVTSETRHMSRRASYECRESAANVTASA